MRAEQNPRRSEAFRALREVESIGPQIADELVAFFAENRNRAVVSELLPFMKVRSMTTVSGGALSGTTVAFTGRLSGMTRKQARQRALELGARVSDTISHSTDILVVGAHAGH